MNMDETKLAALIAAAREVVVQRRSPSGESLRRRREALDAAIDRLNDAVAAVQANAADANPPAHP